MKPLQPKAQMVIIWKALIDYVGENVRAGRSVNIKKFGCFTFDCQTELPKIANRSVSPNGVQDYLTHRLERKNVHHVTPQFVVDPQLQYHLVRFNNKEVFTPFAKNSIYSKAFRTIYANPVPIAAAACLGKDVVNDALNTIFLAIHDLIKFDKDINLAFGFCNVRFINRNMKAVFLKDLSTNIGSAQFENKMQRQSSPVSTLWKTQYGDKWAMSTLSSLVMRPNNTMTSALNDKTQALRIMSLDMSSSGRFFNPSKTQC